MLLRILIMFKETWPPFSRQPLDILFKAVGQPLGIGVMLFYRSVLGEEMQVVLKIFKCSFEF
jgi:hypothetical protein